MSKRMWTIYGAAWLLTVLIAVVDWIWAGRIGFRVERASVMQSVKIIPALAAVSGLLFSISRAPYKKAARKSFYLNVSQVFMWITVLVTFTQVCVVFQYLSVTTGFPLVTNTLLFFDSALGFHWSDVYQWVKAHRWIHSVLDLAYASGSYQFFVIPSILAFTRNSRDYGEFVVQFVVSAILVILVSITLPAESAFVHFGVQDPDTASTVSDFDLFRNGHARELVLFSAQGLVSFPSLHTILALCFAYSLRHARFIFPIGIALNLLMILSTPTQGGHYLSDVLSGLVVGTLVIFSVRRVVGRSASPNSRRQSDQVQHVTVRPENVASTCLEAD
jgi:membrane-associated phospholipid phosphatase